jgi:hypothetical protein
MEKTSDMIIGRSIMVAASRMGSRLQSERLVTRLLQYLESCFLVSSPYDAIDVDGKPALLPSVQQVEQTMVLEEGNN